MTEDPITTPSQAANPGCAVPAEVSRPPQKRRGRGFPLAPVCAALLAAAPLSASEALDVPSGQPVHLDEILSDENPGALWLRFRFRAPKIGGTTDYDSASRDMEYLCRTLVVPYAELHGLKPARVVISLSDRTVPFGQSDPDATQFFEAFRLEDATCIWEEF
ncbi:hypothetical protein SAMN05444007_105168 [Cribrihabitans marinus]|uniref:Acetolactate synthase n=1 Tax=Cribrihabitans marinus TaxID=1227549 RepID=A0A1H6ZKH8_9RHOB|nr:DUF6497 family protein [Cribrihabitans marinus]SEJ53758.1 hypothetical protein SAMN05444007_105168 [Cribrihabitans marinus]